MAIQARTVSVTVEINETALSLKDIRDTVRSVVEGCDIGRVRTVQVNAIQGSRAKGKKKAAKRK